MCVSAAVPVEDGTALSHQPASLGKAGSTASGFLFCKRGLWVLLCRGGFLEDMHMTRMELARGAVAEW